MLSQNLQHIFRLACIFEHHAVTLAFGEKRNISPDGVGLGLRGNDQSVRKAKCGSNFEEDMHDERLIGNTGQAMKRPFHCLSPLNNAAGANQKLNFAASEISLWPVLLSVVPAGFVLIMLPFVSKPMYIFGSYALNQFQE